MAAAYFTAELVAAVPAAELVAAVPAAKLATAYLTPKLAAGSFAGHPVSDPTELVAATVASFSSPVGMATTQHKPPPTGHRESAADNRQPPGNASSRALSVGLELADLHGRSLL
jgi:hypothetical protein